MQFPVPELSPYHNDKYQKMKKSQESMKYLSMMKWLIEEYAKESGHSARDLFAIGGFGPFGSFEHNRPLCDLCDKYGITFSSGSVQTWAHANVGYFFYGLHEEKK